MNGAIGWVLQDNGLWKSANGKILLYNSEKNRNPDPMEKLGRHNFQKAEIKEVLVGDDQYVVLIIYYTGGAFEFPDLRQGFKKSKDAEYYVFRAEKLDEILPMSAAINDPYAVNLEVFAYDNLIDFDAKEIDVKISYNILRTLELEEKSQTTAILSLMPVITNGTKYYRFRIVKLLNKKSIYLKYLLEENKDKLFTRSYFEVPFNDFVSFFGAIEVIKHDYNVYDPQNFVEFYKRGVMRYDRNNYEGARKDFNSAIQLEPENRFMMLYAYLGSAQHELENYPAAIRAFDKAVLFEPTDPTQRPAWVRVYYNRGVSKYKMEDKLNACKDMNKAKKLGLNDEDALDHIKKLCKGKLKDVIAK
jgi:tetratricopeptide (TPR) repeat protein